MRFSERATLGNHPLRKHLMKLMDEKETNLALTADVTSSKELLQIADELGPEMCILKTHIDILHDFTYDVALELRRLADKHQFILFEDRKFADIGNTVLHQYRDGIYRISSWAHLTNAHMLPGPGIIEALSQEGLKRGNGLLLLAQMSSKDNLFDAEYTQKTVEYAKKYSDFVLGFITQQKITDDPSFLHLVPGIQLTEGKDNLGQQYRTIEQAIINDGCDIIIVGRGILKDPNPIQAAQAYRKRGWEAYMSVIPK